MKKIKFNKIAAVLSAMTLTVMYVPDFYSWSVYAEKNEILNHDPPSDMGTESDSTESSSEIVTDTIFNVSDKETISSETVYETVTDEISEEETELSESTSGVITSETESEVSISEDKNETIILETICETAEESEETQTYAADLEKEFTSMPVLLADTYTYYDPILSSTSTISATLIDSSSYFTTNGYDLSDVWYYINGDVSCDSRIYIVGTVNIILADGCNFTANEGINVEYGSSLTIWGESKNYTGSLTATGSAKAAGIGSNSDTDCGSITINGGIITASGGYQSAGIGGGENVSGGIININGGTITSTGYSAAGIGGGYCGDGGTITITGGTVTAFGDMWGAGIGGGDCDNGGTITITGGTITASGGDSGAGIGGGESGGCGTITITGGTVVATGGDSAAGIGSGAGYVDNGTINISGNSTKITVTSGSGADGIGKGKGAKDSPDVSVTVPYVTENETKRYSLNLTDCEITSGDYKIYGESCLYAAGSLTISPTLEKTNGQKFYWSATGIYLSSSKTYAETLSVTMPSNAASISCKTVYVYYDPSYYGTKTVESATLIDSSSYFTTNGYDLTNGWYYISGEVSCDSRIYIEGTVNIILADGCNFTANEGISVNKGKSLTIWSETRDGTGSLNSTASTLSNTYVYYSGIGSDYCCSSGDITINGGIITAAGGAEGGPGIGVGKYGDTCGDIIINGGTITATGGAYAAGIGSGDASTDVVSNITITGGTVTASGGTYAAGIGGGNGGQGGNITITGGTVTAYSGEEGSGIGGGACSSGDNIITITGGTVTAVGNNNGAGIGGGYEGSIGTITISGNSTKINVTSGQNSEGIGGGYKSIKNNSNVSVTVPYVTENETKRYSLNLTDCEITSGDYKIYGESCLYAAGSLTISPTLEKTNGQKFYWSADGISLTNSLSDTLSVTMPSNTASVDCIAVNVTEKSYYDPVSNSIKTESQVIYINSSDSENYLNLSPGWYYISGTITCSRRITVSGDVNIILADDCNFTASSGITVNEGNSLTIWSESEDGTGKLTATGSDDNSGIGGLSSNSGIITINGGNITAVGKYTGAGIGGSSGKKGTIYINGGTVNAAGAHGAAIGSGDMCRYDNAGTVVITGGTVTATSTSAAAAIGGGGSSDGNVTITGGTVTATAVKNSDDSYSGNGAAIGGGDSSSNGYVTITGGTVTAESTNGAAIGGGSRGYGYVTITDAVVTAISENGNNIGNGSTYKVSDEDSNSEVEKGYKINYDKTKISVSINGEYNIINGFYYIFSGTNVTFNSLEQPVSGECYSWILTGYTLDDPLSLSITITMPENEITVDYEIVSVYYYYDPVSDSTKVCKTATLIDSSSYLTTNSYKLSDGWYYISGEFSCSSRITVSEEVNIILADNCSFTTSEGISVIETNSLTIWSETKNNSGSLTAALSSGYNSAIGGVNSKTGGNITINGGKITAAGYYGAGIGGGYSGSGGNITINGGEITADSSYYGAGIGGGDNGSGGNIIINGGEITATGYRGAGIGGGYHGSGDSITINGGIVTANGSGVFGAAIGGGHSGSGGDITINGGIVTANGATGAAAIGGGNSGNSGTIIIRNGTVTAIGGTYAAGIGGGYSGSGEKITITGGEITAKGGTYAAGIGGGYYSSSKNTGGESGVIEISGDDAEITVSGSGDNTEGIGCGDGGTKNSPNVSVTVPCVIEKDVARYRLALTDCTITSGDYKIYGENCLYVAADAASVKAKNSLSEGYCNEWTTSNISKYTSSKGQTFSFTMPTNVASISVSVIKCADHNHTNLTHTQKTDNDSIKENYTPQECDYCDSGPDPNTQYFIVTIPKEVKISDEGGSGKVSVENKLGYSKTLSVTTDSSVTLNRDDSNKLTSSVDFSMMKISVTNDNMRTETVTFGKPVYNNDSSATIPAGEYTGTLTFTITLE